MGVHWNSSTPVWGGKWRRFEKRLTVPTRSGSSIDSGRFKREIAYRFACARWEASRGVSDVWQAKDLREGVFGSVAMAGLTGEFSEVWQGKDLQDTELGRVRNRSKTKDGI